MFLFFCFLFFLFVVLRGLQMGAIVIVTRDYEDEL